MLKPIAESGEKQEPGTYAIVAARYNALYTDALVKFASAELKRLSALRVDVYRVPGSFEIPVVAAALARQMRDPYDAVVCIGVVFQGKTGHAQQVADGVTGTLSDLAARHGVPMIHCVQFFSDEESARQRCLQIDHNRGIEAARAAAEMAGVMRSLRRLGIAEAWGDRPPSPIS